MEYGLQIAGMEPQQFRDVAQAAEGLGYDLLLFPDHLISEGPEQQLEPNALNHDHVAMAAVVAEATRKIRVGHLVLCNLFRHPSITAQSLMTLDHISRGRLVAGLGTGWMETEFKMSGIPFPPIAERLRMLDEALTVMRSLWTKERTTFEGEFYRLHDAILSPKPIQKPHPPILLGGSGKGLLRIAAKHADVLNIIQDAGRPGKIALADLRKMTDAAFAEKTQFVRDEAKRLGRGADAVRFSNVMFIVMLTDTPAAAKQACEGMSAAFGVPADALPSMPIAMIGTPEQCVAEIRRRAKAWGVSQFIFSGGLGIEQIRRIKEQVIAKV